jgi:hypothetical protein
MAGRIKKEPGVAEKSKGSPTPRTVKRRRIVDSSDDSDEDYEPVIDHFTSI